MSVIYGVSAHGNCNYIWSNKMNIWIILVDIEGRQMKLYEMIFFQLRTPRYKIPTKSGHNRKRKKQPLVISQWRPNRTNERSLALPPSFSSPSLRRESHVVSKPIGVSLASDTVGCPCLAAPVTPGTKTNFPTATFVGGKSSASGICLEVYPLFLSSKMLIPAYSSFFPLQTLICVLCNFINIFYWFYNIWPPIQKADNWKRIDCFWRLEEKFDKCIPMKSCLAGKLLPRSCATRPGTATRWPCRPGTWPPRGVASTTGAAAEPPSSSAERTTARSREVPAGRNSGAREGQWTFQ